MFEFAETVSIDASVDGLWNYLRRSIEWGLVHVARGVAKDRMHARRELEYIKHDIER